MTMTAKHKESLDYKQEDMRIANKQVYVEDKFKQAMTAKKQTAVMWLIEKL